MTRFVLGQNQYGKAENRVVKVTRDGDTHHIKDLNVSVALSGDMEEVHRSGSNANVLPTDTTKNTVFAFAKEHGIDSAEDFGIKLARHFVDDTAPIHRARIRIEEYSWERIETSKGGARFVGADEIAHSFVRKGQETRLAQITYDGHGIQVLSGFKDLTVLNTTNSEFWGLPEGQVHHPPGGLRPYPRHHRLHLVAAQLGRHRLPRPPTGTAPTPASASTPSRPSPRPTRTPSSRPSSRWAYEC
ncbi:hypothetical protein GCM10020256_13060 [Streptomyces thermocoprophilus]